MQWTSNHHVHQKLGIVRMLMHCMETLIMDESRVKTKKEKVRVALGNYEYPKWALKEGAELGERGRKKLRTWREGQTGGEN